MSTQGWVETIVAGTVSGITLTAAAEAILIPDTPFVANYFYPGRIVRARLFGKASAVITTPGTLDLRVRWGGVAGTVLTDTGALTQRSASASTNESWEWETLIMCGASGSSGTFSAFSKAIRQNKQNAAATDSAPDLAPVSGNAPVTVDTTTAKSLSFTAQPSLTTASITCLGWIIESLT